MEQKTAEYDRNTEKGKPILYRIMKVIRNVNTFTPEYLSAEGTKEIDHLIRNVNRTICLSAHTVTV
jgi:hypothetical protein